MSVGGVQYLVYLNSTIDIISAGRCSERCRRSKVWLAILCMAKGGKHTERTVHKWYNKQPDSKVVLICREGVENLS